ncbi:hypothetical protein PVAP13_1KG457300 [Panicum virgatum]|uniref:Uncharacterized protein n=1 Tax=Panicum virgatum TaxID=38727 RepID=A0A8T0XR59_PANVG|nr:hypothetical protein PVAP13_1KG457300 [Panicum virgatum]
MRPSQSRLASSFPFPIHPKGLNPSLASPRAPAAGASPPSPDAGAGASTRRRQRISSRAARPPAPCGLCAPNASSTPTTARSTPSARHRGWQRRRTAPSSAAARAGPVSRLPDPAAAPAVTVLLMCQSQFAAHALRYEIVL